MGWLDDVRKKKSDDDKPLPKELEGKTPEELAAALSENAALKAKVQELEVKGQEDAAKVSAIETEFNKIKANLAAVDASKNKQEAPEELANFIDDPDKAFGQRVAPLAAVAINSSTMTARILAQQTLDNQDLASPPESRTIDGRLFRAWSSEIESEAKKYPPASMVTPQAWLGIFFYLKGLHADELANSEVRKKKYNFIEPAASSVPLRSEGTKTPSEELTDEEKRVADRMGVSHENYLKRKKSMKFAIA